MSTLFVSIASYRDPELIPTLINMIDNAAASENLHIAVCWQQQEKRPVFEMAGMILREKSSLAMFEKRVYDYFDARITVIDVDYYQSEGACWARSLAESCYDNEHYFLQIDSHCRFIRHWDQEMMALHTALKRKSARPVLSCYPPGYEPGENEARGEEVNRVIFREFNTSGIPLFCPKILTSTEPVRSSFLAAGFIFAEGCFVKEVPNDPTIFFEGEEITQSARAFTHGYDIYTPDKILLWHYYTRKHHARIWDDHHREARDQGKIQLTWWEREHRSRQRIKHFFGLEEDPSCCSGSFMPGPVRSLKDFAYSCGIDFINRAVQPEVLAKEKISFFPYPPTDPAAWEKRLISPHRKKVVINPHDISSDQEKITYWSLIVVDSNNSILESINFTQKALQEKRARADDGAFNVLLTFNTLVNIQPTTIRITPFYADEGWGETKEIPW